MDDAKRVRLRVNDRWYGGWKGFSITRSLESVAGEWDMTASNAWANVPLAARPGAGDEVDIWLGDQRALFGHIEQDNDGFDATSSSLAFGGRSLVGDLVDSAAPPGVVRGLTLGQIAVLWASPFGIAVRVDADSPRIEAHRPIPGETIIASLQRAGAQHQRILIDAPDGRLVVTQGGGAVSDGVLVAGGARANIKAASRVIDLSQRFRTYQCRGQTVSEGAALDRFNEQLVDDVFSSGRPRTLALQNDSGGPRRTAAERVRVEAARRAGKSHVYEVTVQGWHQPDGSLWNINEVVPVTIPRYSLRYTPLLVLKATYSLDDGGSLTKMTVGPAVGWTPIPVTTKKAPIVSVRGGLLTAEERARVESGSKTGALSPTRSKERTP